MREPGVVPGDGEENYKIMFQVPVTTAPVDQVCPPNQTSRQSWCSVGLDMTWDTWPELERGSKQHSTSEVAIFKDSEWNYR